jgi:hypothetical protein
MGEQNQIQYLTNEQIDKSKWDACIDTAPNGLIYAYSFYLDAMAKNWDALVLGDYEAVMPLTWNKKYGFYYLYQPAFTASLGVFGKDLNEQLIGAFIKAIPVKFKLVEILLNSSNISNPENELRSNYYLPLHQPYTEISNVYRENHSRNIKKAYQLGCSIKKNIPADDVININREQMNGPGSLKENDYKNFKKVFTQLKERNQAETYSINNESNTILASCVFFYSHNRAYYILVGNTVEGKTTGASHALIDAFIKDNAGKNLILDFEGSYIANLAMFYKGFGAIEEKYRFLKINRLPLYLKWLKQ